MPPWLQALINAALAQNPNLIPLGHPGPGGVPYATGVGGLSPVHPGPGGNPYTTGGGGLERVPVRPVAPAWNPPTPPMQVPAGPPPGSVMLPGGGYVSADYSGFAGTPYANMIRQRPEPVPTGLPAQREPMEVPTWKRNIGGPPVSSPVTSFHGVQRPYEAQPIYRPITSKRRY